MIFIDTNYFLRFLINDGTNQFKEVKNLISRASEGEIVVTTDLIVIFEIYWVLGKIYKFSNLQVKKALLSVCNFNFLILPEKQVILDAIHNLEQFNYDLEDAYHFFNCKANKINSIATFDKKLKKKFDLILKTEK